MKGLKKKSVEEKSSTSKLNNIKETSIESNFREEDDNEESSISFGEILQEDVFDKSIEGDNNESKERINDVRKDGRRERGHDEGQENHDQKSQVGRKEETSSKEKSIKQEESSKENIQEKITFKHGTPKEISVFVSAKIATLPYENVDISNGITLTLPPNADHATTVLARAEAYEYCENFIALRVAEIRKALAGTKK